jgi:hypothetical protein
LSGRRAMIRMRTVRPRQARPLDQPPDGRGRLAFRLERTGSPPNSAGRASQPNAEPSSPITTRSDIVGKGSSRVSLWPCGLPLNCFSQSGCAFRPLRPIFSSYPDYSPKCVRACPPVPQSSRSGKKDRPPPGVPACFPGHGKGGSAAAQLAHVRPCRAVHACCTASTVSISAATTSRWPGA